MSCQKGMLLLSLDGPLFLIPLKVENFRFRNVPLNEILDASNLGLLSKLELQELRDKFEQPWNRWHTIRTVSSFMSFLLLLVGILYSK